MGMALVLATRNPAKAARLRGLLDGLDLDLSDGASFPDAPDVDEEGGSHLAIAIGKAVAWSRALGALVVASDGGLSIPALGDGWSSLITRRGTGEGVPDEERARAACCAACVTSRASAARAGGRRRWPSRAPASCWARGGERAGGPHRARLRPASGRRGRLLGERPLGDARRRPPLGARPR